MLRRIRMVAPVLVCFATLVAFSGPAVAEGLMADPHDPGGAALPTSGLTDVVVDVVQYAWSTICQVIL